MAKKILVVDDEPDVMDIATVRLKYLGYEIIPAFDAEQALAILQKDTPDLILLDLLLPKMQGDELCKKLKSAGKFKGIPVILFTASTIRPRLLENIKEMGADDCIAKPFEPEDLVEKVKKYIGQPD
jgi:CheY-like chemotaxis protein